MHMAIDHNDEELVKALTKYKTLIEKPLHFKDSKLPPLHFAVLKKRIEIIQILVDSGADPRSTCNCDIAFRKSKEDLTATRLAMEMGEEAIGEILLQATVQTGN